MRATDASARRGVRHARSTGGATAPFQASPDAVIDLTEGRQVADVRHPREAVGSPARELAATTAVATSAPTTMQRILTARPATPYAVELSRMIRRLVVLDLIVGVIAGVIAATVRFGDEIAITGHDYVFVTIGLPLLWVMTLWLSRAYERRFVSQNTDAYRRVLNATVTLIATVAFVSWIAHSEFARGYALVAFPLLAVGSLAARAAMHHRMRSQSPNVPRQRAVVIGTERASAEFIRRLATSADHPYEVVGVLVDAHSSSAVEGVPVVGNSHDALHAVVSLNADTVAIAPWSTYSQDDLKRLIWQLEGTGVEVVVAPNLTDVSGPRIQVRPTAGIPLLHVDEPEFTGPRRVMKSAFDRTTALVALILLSPFMLAMMIAVRFDSRGPAFFKQQRVGLDGETFPMIKFRSMYVDAEDRLAEVEALNVHGDGPLLKVHDDPRITRLGKVLRRTSLDELPQLWNVVRGQMSLVGPRPPLPREVAEYDDHVHRRFLVPPGITGLWQVSGRSDLTWQESVRLDLDYVENWSIPLDISILLRTIGVVIRGRGAY